MMKHNVRAASGVAILDLNGEVDISDASELRKTLFDLLDKHAGRLLVNMGSVAYIDSAGLSVLIAAHRRANSTKGVLGLSNLQTPVQQVLNLTRMSNVLHTFSTVEEGVAALKNDT